MKMIKNDDSEAPFRESQDELDRRHGRRPYLKRRWFSPKFCILNVQRYIFFEPEILFL